MYRIEWPFNDLKQAAHPTNRVWDWKTRDSRVWDWKVYSLRVFSLTVCDSDTSTAYVSSHVKVLDLIRGSGLSCHLYYCFCNAHHPHSASPDSLQIIMFRFSQDPVVCVLSTRAILHRCIASRRRTICVSDLSQLECFQVVCIAAAISIPNDQVVLSMHAQRICWGLAELENKILERPAQCFRC